MMSEKVYSDREVLNILSEHCELTRWEWDDEGLRPSSFTIISRFGSWNEAKEEAGCPKKNIYPGSERRSYSDEELLDALRRNSDKGVTQWGEEGITPSANTISKRFGSWNEARKKAGLKPRPKGFPVVHPTSTERVREVFGRKSVVTSAELKEQCNVHHPIRQICKLRDEFDIEKVPVAKSHRSRGSAKYSALDLVDLNPSTKIYYTDEIDLARFLEDHLRFDLNENLAVGKKRSLTEYLKGRVPEKTFEYLHSLYIRNSYSEEREEEDE